MATQATHLQFDWQVAVPDGPATLPVGARAPRFDELLGADGRRYGLASFKDSQLVVLVFSSNRCPTAKAYTDRLRRLQAHYGPRGVQVVAINSNDPHLYSEERYSRMVSFARENEYTFPYLLDDGQRLARAYGPRTTFHVFVLDQERRLRYEGRFDDGRVPANVTTNDLANALDDLLAGRDVAVNRTLPFGCSLDITAGSAPTSQSYIQPILLATIAAAWLLTGVAQLTGQAGLLHHDSLIDSGTSFGLGLLTSTLAWQVMVVAMMLPASVKVVQTFEQITRARRQSQVAVAGFLAAFFAVWAAVGLSFFIGDAALHRVVDAIPWLAERAWLIQAGVLAVAGGYQLLPTKRRCLESCREAAASVDSSSLGFDAGARHAMDCVANTGALMLLMFAAGEANLGWMVGLTGVMVYEAIGRHGYALSRLVGVALLFLSLLAVTSAGLPSWLFG